ncbi:Brr6-like protein number 1 [Tuber indicum]|nr:Brr6-like protein number 1 [Tuber indicum]
MGERGHESPMDFQYDGTGPIDPSSPFRMAALNNSLTPTAQKKRNLSSFQFDTSKPLTLTPPSSQTFHFQTASRPAPPLYKGASFTTPRQTADAPRKPLSPTSCGATEGSDMGTPETPQVPRSPTKGSPTRSLALISPIRKTGRGEIKRVGNDGSINKIRRRRMNQKFERGDWWMISGPAGSASEGEDQGAEDDEDDNGDDGQQIYEDMSTPRRWGSKAKSAATRWAQTHREIPIIASQYLQLFFNLSMVLLLLYAVFCFYLTVRRDVDQKVEEYSAEIVQEMSQCAKEYVENRCDPGMRVPAMEIRCTAWERCMNRDPTLVGRARVSAETFAEIINSFIEPISYKTMFFCTILFFGGLAISNMAFGYFRAKALHHPTPYLAATAPMLDHWDPHQQLHEQTGYKSTPGTPMPTTPARGIKYRELRTPGTARKSLQWR